MGRFHIKYLNLLEEHWRKVVILLCGFGIFCGSNLQAAQHAGLSVLEFTLISVSSQHFLMFFLLPLYLYFLVSMLSTRSLMAICRYRFFHTYFLDEMVPIIIFTFIYSLLPMFFALIVGLVAGLPTVIDNRATIIQYQSYARMLHIYQNTFQSLFVATLSTVLYLFVGLVFLSIILRSLFYLFGRKTALFWTAILYLGSIVKIQGGADNMFSYLFLCNYLSLLNALVDNTQIVSLIMMLTISAICIFLMRKRWRGENIC